MSDSDDATRQPQAVMEAAKRSEGEWAAWHPGDGTQYRVRCVRAIGGGNDGMWVLLVSVTDEFCCVPYYPTDHHRFRRFTQARFKRERLNSSDGYDWWTDVVKPLLASEGVA